ncbi:MAG: ATP-dependent Clp protease adapter ClpS [Methylophilaceae bacterium]
MATKQPTGDLAIAPSKIKPKLPAMYKVLLKNDDYTSMEFVVKIIRHFFNKTQEQATEIMLQVHTKGAGVCGVYPKDIAETKMSQVLKSAEESQHPLQCVIELA